MYQEKVDRILVINSYLTKCKINNPNSPVSKAAQKFLTRKINQTLNDNKPKIYSIFPLLSFLFIR
jgi:hypothetical protein